MLKKLKKLQMFKNVCKTYKIVKKYFKKLKMFKNVKNSQKCLKIM